MTTSRRGVTHYTNAELGTLRKLYAEWRGQERFVERIAERLGRSPDAVRGKLHSMGLFSIPDGRSEYNLQHIASLLGRNHTSVLHWVKAGYFEPYMRAHTVKRAIYAICPDELWTWMEDMKSWHLWEPENLTDLAWRQHFAELRKDWLRDHEAAALLQVTPNHVSRLYENGKLPGVKRANRAVWFRREAVLAYVAERTPVEERLARLESEIARLTLLLERRGILAEGYPVKARYAYQGTER